MLDVQFVREAKRDYPGILTKVTPRFLDEAGVMVLGTAKRLVPVDSGNLRGSIGRWRDGNTEVVGTNVEYAEHVEYGTRHMSAQPYLRPAIDENRRGVIRRLVELVRAEILHGRS